MIERRDSVVKSPIVIESDLESELLPASDDFKNRWVVPIKRGHSEIEGDFSFVNGYSRWTGITSTSVGMCWPCPKKSQVKHHRLSL